MSRYTVAFIFARGGSKGVPGKNIRPIGGKPMLARAIECAKAVPGIDRVVVSTDDPAIAVVARQWGADVPFMRPAELAGDTAPELLAWRHALTTLAEQEGRMPEVFVSVPAVAPLRQPEDLARCLEAFNQGGCDVVITVKEAERSPWFNMVTIGADGLARRVIEPEIPVVRRQDAPEVFDMTTVCYVVDPAYILANDALFGGRVRAVKVPRERALDIDTELDFKIAEFLLTTAS